MSFSTFLLTQNFIHLDFGHCAGRRYLSESVVVIVVLCSAPSALVCYHQQRSGQLRMFNP